MPEIDRWRIHAVHDARRQQVVMERAAGHRLARCADTRTCSGDGRLVNTAFHSATACRGCARDRSVAVPREAVRFVARARRRSRADAMASRAFCASTSPVSSGCSAIERARAQAQRETRRDARERRR